MKILNRPTLNTFHGIVDNITERDTWYGIPDGIYVKPFDLVITKEFIEFYNALFLLLPSTKVIEFEENSGSL